MPKSYVIVAKTRARFEDVVDVVGKINDASSIHAEYFDCATKAAVFIGEKYFFRTFSWASAVTIIKDLGGEVVIRIVTTGGGGGLLNVDYGANKSYAWNILDNIKNRLAVEVIKEIDNYNVSMRKSTFLPGEET